MNIFQKYTARCLMKNKSRTIVTIIGILLSTAMVTAVIQAANSGLEYLKRAEIEQNGAYHAIFRNVSKEETEKLLQTDLIDDMTAWQEVGWALTESTNASKPYLLIESIPADLENFVAVHLFAGRMPENETEIVLPKHLDYNGEVSFQIGDQFTLEVGTRTPMDQFFPLTMDNAYDKDQETLVNCSTHTYTVVGIYDRFSYEIEPYSCPGYTALTTGPAEGPRTLFATLDNIQGISEELRGTGGSLAFLRDKAILHNTLIRLSGKFRNGNLVQLLYGFVAILILLIGFGSVMLIYNSFSISVSERTKQFGILKSIGATKKQIRQSVLFEGFLLCLVGIPLGILSGCIGIGITLWCLRDSFTPLLGSTVQMRLIISPIGILFTICISLIITLISAWIPARRAIRGNAIDAIRQSQDIRLKQRQVRTLGFTRKLFGFKGMMASKNFKRNKKRYRSTIISLFLSIVLFVSTSAFCYYLTSSVEGIGSSDAKQDLELTYYQTKEVSYDEEEILKMISGTQGVDAVYRYEENHNDSFLVPSNLLSEEYLAFTSVDDQFASLILPYVFVDDASFRTLCEQNHLSPESFMDSEHPLGLFYNRSVLLMGDADQAKWVTLKPLQEKTLPCELTRVHRMKLPEYTAFPEEKILIEDQWMIPYYPNEYLQSDIDTPDISMAQLVPIEEAEIKTSFQIGAFIETLLPGLAHDSPQLIYPNSCKETLMAKDFIPIVNYSILAQNHRLAYENLQNNLQKLNINGNTWLHNYAEQEESNRMMITVIRVFSYGFITLISLIAIANVFNTISTNIALRRREFAMLRSVGLTERALQKMMNYECLIYGLKSMLTGLPISFGITYLIWKITVDTVEIPFVLPWLSIGIAVCSVFAVIFITMLYAIGKIRKDNPMDALKDENL